MTRELSWDVKLATVVRYVRGDSLEAIARELGISVGSAHNIAESFRAGGLAGLAYPADVIDAVRDQTRRMSERGLTVEQAAVALELSEGLLDEGVNLEALKSTYLSVKGKARPDEEIGRLVQGARRIAALEEEHGEGIEQILSEGERSMENAKRANEELERVEETRRREQGELSQIREEHNIILELEELKEERDSLLKEIAAARERRRLSVEEANLTESRVKELTGFKSAVEAAGTPLSSSTMKRTVVLVSRTKPATLDRLLDLEDRLANRGWTSSEALAILDRLSALEKEGFDASVMRELGSALSEYGYGSGPGLKLIAEAVRRHGGLGRAKDAADGYIASLDAQIEDAKARLAETVRHEREAAERMDTSQREAHKHLREVNARHAKLSADILAWIEHQKNLQRISGELEGKVFMLQLNIEDLHGRIQEEKARKAEVTSNLEAVLKVKGGVEEFESAMRAMRESSERERKELDSQIDARRALIALADQIKGALMGDLILARGYLSWLASEPIIPPRGREPLPKPEAAREKVVATVLELMKEELVSRTELERVQEEHAAEIARLKGEIQTVSGKLSAAEIALKESEKNLQTRDRELRSVRNDLEAANKRLEWRAEIRAEREKARQPR